MSALPLLLHLRPPCPLHSSPSVIPSVSQHYYCLELPTCYSLCLEHASQLGPSSPSPLYYVSLLTSHNHRVLKVSPSHACTHPPWVLYHMFHAVYFAYCLSPPGPPRTTVQVGLKPTFHSASLTGGFGVALAWRKHPLPPTEGAVLQFVHVFQQGPWTPTAGT